MGYQMVDDGNAKNKGQDPQTPEVSWRLKFLTMPY